jgi:hypothetical protein
MAERRTSLVRWDGGSGCCYGRTCALDARFKIAAGSRQRAGFCREERRGRRRSVSNSAISSVTYKKLRKTHAEVFAQANAGVLPNMFELA